MNTLQRKSYISIIFIVVLQLLFFILFFLDNRGVNKLEQFENKDKQDRLFKSKADELSVPIHNIQESFNRFVLYREIKDLEDYTSGLVTVSDKLNNLFLDKNISTELKDKIGTNIELNKNVILLKKKTDSLIFGMVDFEKSVDLNSILKPQNYKFEDVLNSVEFETNKKVDTVKKKGLFSRVGDAFKGKNDVQKEEINNILKLKFGKKNVSGDIKEQLKNVLIESQKHYNRQFEKIGRGLTTIKLGEKKLIKNNSDLILIYSNIDNELNSIFKDILENNDSKLEAQRKSNKQLRFYLMITIILLILGILFLLYNLVKKTFRVQKQLEIANNQISNDLLLKNKIISILTHEIKTPVHIINLCGFFMSEKSKDPELKEYFDTISYTSNSLLHISNQAVDLVKNEKGNIEIHYEKFNIYSESDALINSLKIFAQSKNISLSYHNNLSENQMLEFDKTKLYQLIYNIVGNGIKFAKSNIVISSKTESSNGNNQVVFSIKDDGLGIKAEDQAKIFDLEFQSQKKNADSLSFGLGLFLCKNIIDAAKGTIKVESEYNKGTEIVFNLNVEKQ